MQSPQDYVLKSVTEWRLTKARPDAMGSGVCLNSTVPGPPRVEAVSKSAGLTPISYMPHDKCVRRRRPGGKSAQGVV